MNTIFFGSSRYVLPVIEQLNTNFDLKLVVTTEQKPTDAVPKYCSQHTIPCVSVKSFRDEQWQDHWKLEIENWKLPFAVLADFGLLIPKDILNMFPKGIVNIHPSLLPKFRGSTPGQSAILDGLQETGVSIMLLDEQLDHGPILTQEKAPIFPTDTSDTLYTRLFTIGSNLLTESLRRYVDNSLTPTPQDDSQATFTPRLTRESGFINIKHMEKLSALEIGNWKLEIVRKVRAYHPWPGVWTIFRSKNVEVRIKLLPENKIQIEGKKPVTYNDFMNGYAWGKEFLEKLHLI